MRRACLRTCYLFPTAARLDQLKTLVDTEGSHLADPDWMGMLAAIGIVKGQPFNPDAKTRDILDRAAKTAYKTSRSIGFEEAVSGRNFRIYPNRRWVNPAADGTPKIPADRSIWRGGEPTADISISTPVSGSSQTITRSVPG